MSAKNYEDILNRYHGIVTRKTGTAYEILAAMVCKVLQERTTVVHDLKLRGDSDVPHQIDVRIATPDGARSVLIECKDFHQRNAKVDLGTVRDFHSAVTDIRPDEAWIMTCIGFTAPALKYAKSKGIKPVVMRLFEDIDMDGRILSVCINTHIITPHDPVANVCIDAGDEALHLRAREKAGIGQGLTPDDDACFELPDGSRRHFNEVITSAMNEAMNGKPDGAMCCNFRPEGRKLFIGGVELPYKGIIVEFARISETLRDEIVATRLAELIVTGIGNDDVIIWDDQLRARSIDAETGEIF